MSRRLTAPVGDGNRAGPADVARLFLRLGITAFGGPAAHVPLMEAEVVTRRAWMTRDEFLDRYAVVQVLPGPNSTELAVHIGHACAGWRGGLLAGAGFVLPAVLMVWALAAITEAPVVLPFITGIGWAIAPAVVAVLLQALWTFGRQALHRPPAPIVLPVTLLLAGVLPGADLLVLAAGALLALVRPSAWRTTAVVVLCGALAGATWLGAQDALSPPIAVAAAAPSPLALLLHFLRAGLSVFGSGYVLLAWLEHDLVIDRHWLSLAALTHAAGLAHVTPGPLFTTATAAGYLIAGNAGAMAATVGIFAPAFLSVPIGAPLRRLVQRSAPVRAALDGVVVASVALLARAAVSFAQSLRGAQWGMLLVAVLLLASRRIGSSLLLLASVSLGIAAALLHLVR